MKNFSEILNINNEKEIKLIFCGIIEKSINFVLRNKIIKNYTKDELIEKVIEPLPKEGKDIKEIIKLFNSDFIPYCVNQANPNYLAFPDSGNSVGGYVADMYKMFLNQNLIADIKSAPIGTYIEIQVLSWFRQLVGYNNDNKFPKDISEVGGVVCFGGVMSNTISLLIARSKKYKDSFKNGIVKKNTYLLIPEDINHYSLSLAMGYLGLGAENVVTVKLDSLFRMNLDNLQEKIDSVIEKGGEILAVSAYAGDSRTMQIDNFVEIAKICKKNKIWFHIDACHGGALLFSNKNRELLKGIEEADSIIIDPHKILMVPYPNSIVLFKNPKDLTFVSKNFDMTITKGTFDLGQISPFIGSKSFESLKIWFVIKNMGTKKLGYLIDKRTELARSFQKKIDSDKDFNSLNNVTINSLTFVYFPKDLKERFTKGSNKEKSEIVKVLDKLNKKIHDVIYYEGEACIHTFKLIDMGNRANLKKFGRRQVLGIIIGNPLSTEEHINKIYGKICDIGGKVYKEICKLYTK